MFHPHGMHDLLVEDLVTPNTPYTSRTYLVSRGHKLVITRLLFCHLGFRVIDLSYT